MLFKLIMTWGTGRRWLCVYSDYDSWLKIVSQAAAEPLTGLQHMLRCQCNVLLWWNVIEPSLLCNAPRDWRHDLFSLDLRHCWRDVYSRGHHRLLYIHRFRGLEEDPDRKDVMRITPHLPQHILFISCKVAGLLAKSDPAGTHFLVEIVSPWPMEAALALDLTTRLHATTASQLLELRSGSHLLCWRVDADYRMSASCIFSVRRGEEREAFLLLWGWNLKYCVSGFNQ